MNLLGSWTFVSSASWTWPKEERLVSYQNCVSPNDVPALTEIAERLRADGYTFDRKPVRIYRHESAKNGANSTFYNVNHTAYFTKADGKLAVEVKGHDRPTIEEAIARAAAKTEGIAFYGEPVEGGKGQLKRCKEIALRLVSEHRKHLARDSRVSVPYCTRGGRGGWKDKIARRLWLAGELVEEDEDETGR